MSTPQQEIINSIGLISVFFILLVSIVIITAVLYHNRKRMHKIDLASFENLLLRSQYEVQEHTMQTIGADLHDNIGQLLSLISLTLSTVEISKTEKAQEKIGTALDLTNRSIKDMRQLGKLLQGDQLISAGLNEAILYQIAWLERTGKFDVQYLKGDLPDIPNQDKDLIIFRILQEAINNIVKHAKAKTIVIMLDYLQNSIKLSVTDDGKGFNFEINNLASAGMGLKNIVKRAAAIRAELKIDSSPGAGTKITLYIPYP
ncbi:sensor histidine kinase [Mucilaginibacter angelicae]|uniref:Sensor histidine kinase n=1 Tax=Mucilaginibacter angelicae TaxID=869718 RepID=A0ABV6L6Q9_9SPHI